MAHNSSCQRASGLFVENWGETK